MSGTMNHGIVELLESEVRHINISVYFISFISSDFHISRTVTFVTSYEIDVFPCF